MSLQEQIAVAITSAFEELGGDANQAVEAARHHSRVDDWVQQETAKIAVAGGVEMAIPGIHALTIPAGITFLLHKMATISWGIGAIKGAYIVETSQYSDLRNILTSAQLFTDLYQTVQRVGGVVLFGRNFAPTDFLWCAFGMPPEEYTTARGPWKWTRAVYLNASAVQ